MNRFLLPLLLASLLPGLALAQQCGDTAVNPAPATQPASPALESLVYERVIEWAGDHVQLSLKLVRQADGSYLADVGGEDFKAQTGIVVPASELTELRAALDPMRGFGNDSFGGDGHHWYTTLEASGTNADGTPLTLDLFFYDMDDERAATRARAMEKAAEDLIKRIQAPAASGGFAGVLSTQ